MARAATEVLGQQEAPRSWTREWAKQAAIIVSASLFVALCAHLSVPLPFTPVPLTLSNFGVLSVGLVLGSRRGFAALALYLVEGACGLPVFSASPLGGGIAQILGPTGGFLMAYPVVAFVAGWIFEHKPRSISSAFGWAAFSATAAEVVLFVSGLSWLAMQTHSVSLAIRYGLYWFVFAEVIKIVMSAGITSRWHHQPSAAS
jgi:biotin transport system substrate-specific component